MVIQHCGYYIMRHSLEKSAMRHSLEKSVVGIDMEHVVAIQSTMFATNGSEQQ